MALLIKQTPICEKEQRRLLISNCKLVSPRIKLERVTSDRHKDRNYCILLRYLAVFIK